MSNALLEAAAALEAHGGTEGPERHRRLHALFWASGGNAESSAEALAGRLRPAPPARKPWTPKTAEKVETLFRIWKTLGMKVVACRFPSGHPLEECPKFLFTLGTPPEAPFILSAAFNSRKGKDTRRADPWVHALRRVFVCTAEESTTWVSSFGTPLYDLVTCWADLHKKPIVLIAVPSPAQAPWDHFRAIFPGMTPRWFLSCLPGRAACPPKKWVLCRDRMVAAAADRWFVIEIRRGGNLLRVLCDEMSVCPRPFWVFPARSGAPETEGNTAILQAFPRYGRRWPGGSEPMGRSPEKPHGRARPDPRAVLETPPLEEPFLFHYTRSCPGPWPGQSRCAWAEDLFRASPWADHTALDTLWRILMERRLRACGRLIRGQIPVVSWTRVPPQDLSRLTRWNPALIRWTFEPYGIAIKRKVLKTLGARPVIYAREAHYFKIPERDRFRFQLHEPGRPSWKGEKEWRLQGDLSLDALERNDWWAFVPTPEEARWLARHVSRPCRIVPLHLGSVEQPRRKP